MEIGSEKKLSVIFLFW